MDEQRLSQTFNIMSSYIYRVAYSTILRAESASLYAGGVCTHLSRSALRTSQRRAGSAKHVFRGRNTPRHGVFTQPRHCARGA